MSLSQKVPFLLLVKTGVLTGCFNDSSLASLHGSTFLLVYPVYSWLLALFLFGVGLLLGFVVVLFCYFTVTFVNPGLRR